MNKNALIIAVALSAGLSLPLFAQYQGWKHSGTFAVLTTPDGADLPATVSEENFPLLLRLEKDWFNFAQAQAQGEDLRFAVDGKALAYQIDGWDPAAGTANIWVRMPVIKGNAIQEIAMFWGKDGATSESSGKAVFNEANGYLSVFHLDDPSRDEVGTLVAKDMGTVSSAGVFGKGRHFEPNKGIDCGQNITTFPSGSAPHSTELWFKAEKSGDRIVSWGSGGPKTMVQMIISKPPKMTMDCYGSGASLVGKNPVPLHEWIHVIHTFQKGQSRLYVNGQLETESKEEGNPLAITSPVKASLGGWGNYVFQGDMDEVRISKVARSADWVKLQHENQKPQQSLVGPLMQSGAEFSLSEKLITLNEGKNITVVAKAGGARKIFWIIKRGDKEAIVAVDRFHYTLEAGRVTAEETLTLRCKAIFAAGAKTIDIPVTVKEDLPDPVFVLKAPAKWDGRTAIEVVPQISNAAALEAKGVGKMNYVWQVSGIAGIVERAPGKLILKRANNSGTLTVTATADNGGKPSTQSITLAVAEPANDPWVQRTPDNDEQPADSQFFARDDSNEGTLFYRGTQAGESDTVFLKLYADDKLIKTSSQKLKQDRSYSFAMKLKAGLIRYKVEFGAGSGATEKVERTVNNLVCGDAYIIEGQSNAVGYNYENTRAREDLTHTDSPWIRSFGGNGEVNGDPLTGGWGNARVERIKPNDPDRIHFISAWGMAMAKKFVENQKIPVCIFNGAVGGTRIDEHMPTELVPANKDRQIYANLKKRVVAARLTHGIRGVLWHQGEADQGFDGPNNCYGCETYQQYWIDLTAAWKQDYPNIRNYYVYQIYPNACSQGGNRHSDKLRDVQRRLGHIFSHLTVMPTLDIASGASCHFKTDDYEKMGLLMAPLLERDACSVKFDKPVTAADLKKAYFSSDKKDEIVLEFDQAMLWDDVQAVQFYLDGEAGKIVSGTSSGTQIVLKLAAPATAKTITYLTDKKWESKLLLYGKNGIAALTFCEVEIGSGKE